MRQEAGSAAHITAARNSGAPNAAMTARITGALAGWKWSGGNHGVVMHLQVARSASAFAEQRFELVDVALNDRQLRSLARDLTRAMHQRGIALGPRRSWWRRLLDLQPDWL